MRTAEQVFDQYISNFAPKCPIVVFPPGATAAIVRENKPLLFLSILSIASAGYCTVAKQRELTIEVKNQLADRAIVQGEKSLELVQAFQVTSLWYRAPDEYRQMNLSQLVQITTTMAIDLGLDKIDVFKPAATAQENRRTNRIPSFSLILRRPNLTIWTAKVDDYLADLQQTKAAATDEFLCRLVATERLCHDINQELFLSDPVRSLSRQDPKTQLIIQGFQDRNDALSLVRLHPLQKAIVQFGRFASSVYAHELALHVNNNIDEFKAPFFAESLKTCKLVDVQDSNTSHLSMLRIIVIASRGLLDTFIKLSISDMLALPPHIYGGRVIYAVVLLMKLHKTITESGKESSNSIHFEELHLETYLEQLVTISKILIAKDERSALSRAFLIMPQLMGWFYLHWSRRPSGADGSNMTEDLLTNNSNGQGSSASQAPTGTFGGSPIAIQTLGHNAPLENAVPLGGPGHQIDQLIQHSVLPSSPMYSRENSFEARGLTVTPDDWFTEFFNVEMLG
ncbi:hypothetical protein P168DRAFT_276538 [Aspergillus campestris IBT 28561]|uniref:Transcription factor domain-containing protein n=1 Tax=Aspergillus campestris (strain IBT 28561) TaxID=1392248 RepID=A0A2I1CR65_ASPC2|nr:uncharacterized protein P168DRAFT_276538 [Aspergillus campestris IBT 28561]PKY00105.1 hypothetical protein P168DRAFT_276538 [Aspergillus campestris IBT 28561]